VISRVAIRVGILICEARKNAAGKRFEGCSEVRLS